MRGNRKKGVDAEGHTDGTRWFGYGDDTELLEEVGRVVAALLDGRPYNSAEVRITCLGQDDHHVHFVRPNKSASFTNDNKGGG